MSAQDANVAEIVRDPSWFVTDYDAAREALSFVRADRATFAAQPFLDRRWKRDALASRIVPLEAVAEALPQDACPPALNFIWHTSFCCSTLLADLLDLPGRNLSYREPMALVSVADAKRASGFGGPPVPPRLLEAVLFFLARTPTGEQCLVKPSNFANTLIEDVARKTPGRMLFLFADLESFLISVEKGGDGLGKYVRRLFGNLARDGGGAPLPWPVHEILHMSDLEIAAVCWHLQMAQFERSAKALGQGRTATLDCADLLANPSSALAHVASFFRLGFSEQDIANVVAGPALRRHAKQPAHAFDAAQRQRQAEDVRRRLGRDLPRIVEWSFRACRDTRASAGWPGPLQGAAKSLIALGQD